MYGPVRAPPDPLPLAIHTYHRQARLKPTMDEDPTLLDASADLALVVAQHERRLDHVGERRHLRITSDKFPCVSIFA